ncbi:MAG: prepilin peptidase [Patescibacteria group bacterium]
MEYILIALVGASIGSFIGVIIDRLQSSESVLYGRSRCSSCRNILQWFELVPIVSFLLQKGACRKCKAQIPWRDWYVEVVLAALFVIVYMVFVHSGFGIGVLFGDGFVQVAWFWLITSLLVLIFLYDLFYYLILDIVTLPAIGLIFIVHAFELVPIAPTLQSMLIGAAIAGGLFLVQFVVSKGTWIGGGDIRLGVLMGVILGWQQTIAALGIAYVVGAVVGIILIMSHKKKLQSQVPFGTFLAAATFVSMLWGESIINWYLHAL